MKQISLENLLPLIPRTGTIVFSHAASTSQEIIELLVDHADQFYNLEIIHMVPVVQPKYCDTKYASNFVHNALFAGPSTKIAIKEGRANYTPIFFSSVPQYLNNRNIDLFITQVSRTIQGEVSLGISVDYSLAAMHSAKITVAIQNNNMPFTLGDSVISTKSFNYIIEANTYLPEISYSLSQNTVYSRIASHIKPLINDGATLQVGIGALPDAILAKIQDKNDLGVHSEMVSSGIVDLMKNGNITNAFKKIDTGASVVSFAIGNKSLYDYLDKNENVLFKDISYVNNPYIIGQNENVISINSALQVDLHGQVNAEMINGIQVSGVGGQIDFVRGAQLSKNGKSIIAFPSTNNEGTISRITRKIGTDGIVTTSRNDVDYICTEFGCVKLSGRTLADRKKLLGSIAHPRFRDALLD